MGSSSILEPISMNRRIYSGLDIFLIWAGANTCIATIFTGGLIAPRLGILLSILVIIIGSLVGGLILGLVGTLGYYYGLPTMVITRRVFGDRFSYLASFFNVIQLIGWASILLYVSAEAISVAIKSFSIVDGYLTDPVVWVIIIGVLETLYALRGLEKIIWYHRISVVTLIIALIYESYFIIVSLLSNASSSLFMSNMDVDSLLWGLDIVLATAISWSPLIADYTRYSRSYSASLIGTWSGYTLTSILLYGLGALSAVVANAYLGDPTEVAINLGLNTVFLYFIALSAITTNLINIYSAVVSTQNIFPKTRYSILSLSYGTIILLLSIIPVFLLKFEYFLYYIGDLFIPLTIILVLHKYIGGDRAILPGILTWIIGSGLSIYVTVSMGFGVSLIGIISTLALYPLISKIFWR